MHDTDLLSLFQHDIRTAEQLFELINSEFEALSTRELSQLESILGQKTPLLRLLDQHAGLRSQQLARHGLSPDQQGLKALARLHPQGSELLAASEQLAALLEQCQAGNLRNGKLIRTQQNSTRSALNILRGDEAPSLYDNRGITSGTPRNRPLNQA